MLRPLSFSGTTVIPCRDARTAQTVSELLGQPRWQQPYQRGDRFFVLVDNFTAWGDQRIQERIKERGIRHWITFPECVIFWKDLDQKLQAEIDAGRLQYNNFNETRPPSKKPWFPLFPRI